MNKISIPFFLFLIAFIHSSFSQSGISELRDNLRQRHLDPLKSTVTILKNGHSLNDTIRWTLNKYLLHPKVNFDGKEEIIKSLNSLEDISFERSITICKQNIPLENDEILPAFFALNPRKSPKWEVIHVMKPNSSENDTIEINHDKLKSEDLKKLFLFENDGKYEIIREKPQTETYKIDKRKSKWANHLLQDIYLFNVVGKKDSMVHYYGLNLGFVKYKEGESFFSGWLIKDFKEMKHYLGHPIWNEVFGLNEYWQLFNEVPNKSFPQKTYLPLRPNLNYSKLLEDINPISPISKYLLNSLSATFRIEHEIFVNQDTIQLDLWKSSKNEFWDARIKYKKQIYSNWDYPPQEQRKRFNDFRKSLIRDTNEGLLSPMFFKPGNLNEILSTKNLRIINTKMFIYDVGVIIDGQHESKSFLRFNIDGPDYTHWDLYDFGYMFSLDQNELRPKGITEFKSTMNFDFDKNEIFQSYFQNQQGIDIINRIISNY